MLIGSKEQEVETTLDFGANRNAYQGMGNKYMGFV